MTEDPIVFTIFLIFSGAAVLATVALYARQALLVAYILLGILFGPWALGLVTDPDLIQEISHIGIMFLLFLLGLNLPPKKLVGLLGEATRITLISSTIFALVGMGIAALFGYTFAEQLLIGAALIFSSTILSLKLLPTTALHHQRMGEIIISVLLLQDLLAIGILLALEVHGKGDIPASELAMLLLALPILVLFAYLFTRYILIKLIRRFDKIQEYIFLTAIGWCLGIAELAALLGLSQEIGAFIAGVTLATSPIALYIAESLKPLRDFFLIIFFFSLGAGFQLPILEQVLIPALVLATLSMLFKPLIFKWLLKDSVDKPERALEIGVRMGQVSEFSLLIALLALNLGVIGHEASYLIQATTLLTFIASSYYVVQRYPTPIAVSDKLRRD
ncbi:sodium:proton antiporter [Solemya pervernicosa gill symbiont]|uniref:Sodium:proton antiporter n=1 Tax=Solemya pervernicosa gill symbiont TaxID=642797 RepID=A0A1T2L9T1_9GAMM|nr:cation:proton antiporter [Solemya pervernicosa gill symbiont]OOZ41869.1 sodium:proton antiporter [Solemya pervernicosa gill symbiont]